jgi:very-long-chain ceramide synthase
MKSYYLIQLAFWLHMIVVTCIEVRRSDFWMMLVHHCITSWLVATSYMMNYVRLYPLPCPMPPHCFPAAASDIAC